MARVDLDLPTIGLPITTEDPKTLAALEALVVAVNDVEADQIKDSAVTAAKVETQQSWQSVAMTPSSTWVEATSATAAQLRYYKDSLGVVHLTSEKYRQLSSTTLSTDTIATLPSGYRPVADIYGVFINHDNLGGGATQAVLISTTGAISMTRTSGPSASALAYSFSVQFLAA